MDIENNPMEMTGGEEPTKVEEPVATEPTDPKADEGEPADPEPETPGETLYDLPDGRKVNADTLQTEWRDNFLPEFTRKSQALAKIESEKELNRTPTDEPAWKNPDYQPQNYGEVINIAKEEALTEIRNEQKAEQDRVANIQATVDNELKELKAADPKLDEGALFQHANKYGFQSLKVAHSNMSDMNKAAVDIEQRTVKNLKTREADPISTGAGGELSDETGYDPTEMSQFDGAADYLSHLKGKG